MTIGDPSMDIREVDASGDDRLRAWWDCGRETSLERPHDFWAPWELSRVALPRHDPEQQVVAGYVGSGEVVGVRARAAQSLRSRT